MRSIKPETQTQHDSFFFKYKVLFMKIILHLRKFSIANYYSKNSITLQENLMQFNNYTYNFQYKKLKNDKNQKYKKYKNMKIK